MKIYDISRSISPQTAVWTGDEPFSYEMILQLQNDDSVNLTRIRLSPHTGTHADAPYHVSDSGIHPDKLPLEKYIGVAQVVSIERRHGGIVPDDIQHAITDPVKRLLIHSWISENPDHEFHEDFPYPTVELIDWLADQGAVLLGMDSPSVDAYTSKDLPGHHRLRERGMVWLETLCLKGVPDGKYELIALPLKIAEICGSPVRAILREI
ncbi:MAG TPA: cyclase family protein [Aggregatilineales bacterium]|nr:cyclase family protein [Aggregatilineales bacterium]